MIKKALPILLIACLLCGCGVLPGSKDKIQEPIPNELNIFSYSPDTLNPLFTQNSANVQMLKLLFDGLIKCDTAQRPVPVLAEQFAVSPDGLLWTVILRPNVQFHDGTLLSASDVAASYHQVMQGGDKSIYAPNLRNVTQISCPDDRTITFALQKPQTNFINLLDIPVVKGASAALTTDFQPIGTGTYRFVSQQAKRIELAPNQNWWGGTPADIQTIHVEILPDSNTSTFAYEAKSIDVVNTDSKNWSKYSANSENHIADYPSGNFHFLGVSQKNQWLKSTEIRQTIARSINKNRILNEVLLSHGLLTDTCISPAWWMYDTGATKYEYNPKLAIECVKRQPQKITLKLLLNKGNETKRNVAAIIQECLSDVGIELNIEEVSWDTFVSRVEEGDYDLYFGEINYSTEVNPAYVLGNAEGFEPLFDDLQRQITEDGRLLAYHAIQQKMANELPILPLFFEATAMLYNNKLTGEIVPLRTNLFDGIEKWHIRKE